MAAFVPLRTLNSLGDTGGMIFTPPIKPIVQLLDERDLAVTHMADDWSMTGFHQ
jgi:hypothetical protein